jgi:environmental stress-induced protein Ves
VRIQRFNEHTPMPWANGRGTSYEVSRGGGEVWNWRVAIAPVVEPGPFSPLAGVDRHLVVLDGAPLALTFDGTTRLARRGEVVSFNGESNVVAALPEGPTRDLGLMIRRGVATGSMSVVSAGVGFGRVIVALEESRVESGGLSVVLTVGDVLIGEQSESIEVVSGVVCVIEVE